MITLFRLKKDIDVKCTFCSGLLGLFDFNKNKEKLNETFIINLIILMINEL